MKYLITFVLGLSLGISLFWLDGPINRLKYFSFMCEAYGRSVGKEYHSLRTGNMFTMERLPEEDKLFQSECVEIVRTGIYDSDITYVMIARLKDKLENIGGR